ncbi:MAG: hypothetical protein Q4A00_01840 [Flavobacteriaceae bacterium]|nr:hypothetical protein [Flavobacteriaceae bacterium]
MKKIVCLLSLALVAISCKRANSSLSMEEDKPINKPVLASLCDKVYNTNDTVNPWGVLIRTTCKEGQGDEAPLVENPNTSNSHFDKLLLSKNTMDTGDLTTLNTSNKVKKKAVHFWFYGTDSRKLFKPVTYARVFVFNDDTTDNAKITAAQNQVRGGNHNLGFDSGVFNGIYPTMVLNINHKQGKNGKVLSTFNIESEVKKSFPVGKKIFIQFITQSTPTNPTPNTFNNAKYAYLVFKNEDDKAYPHYKIDMSDRGLGYQGHNFYYNN